MQPEIRFHEIDKWAKEKAQGNHGYAVLRWFYAVYKTEVDGINSAHTSSTRGSRGCPPGTLPCLQGIVCYTCRPQGYGNGGRKVWQSALYHRLGEGAGGWQVYKVRADHLIRWYALGRYRQSSHSPLWASHHAGKLGSFGEKVGAVTSKFAELLSAKKGEIKFTSFPSVQPKCRNSNRCSLLFVHTFP